MKPLKVKIASETGSTVKKLRWLNLPKVRYCRSKNQKLRKNRVGAHLRSHKKTPEDQVTGKGWRRVTQMSADLSFPTERFQQSHTIVTSKNTEARGISISPSRELNQTKGDPDLHADQKPKTSSF